MSTKQDVNHLIGKALRSVRESQNLDQLTVSNDTGIHNSALSHYEAGRRTPSVGTLTTLSAYYSVEPARFLPSLSDIQKATGVISEEGKKNG